MNNVDNQLKTTRHTVNVLREGVEILDSKVDAVKSFIHEEVGNMFQLMERLWCQAQDSVTHIEREITLVRHKDYLRRNVEAAVQGALTGRLTPDILSPEKIDQIVGEH